MLTKNDLVLLLTEIQSNGIDTGKEITRLLRSENIPYDVLQFIDKNRHFEVSSFYELLRKNYNNKKSKLYINLVNEDLSDPTEVLITLSALNLQILLYSKKLENNQMFLKQSRGEEITRVLNNYYKTYDLIPCLKALKVIRADLITFEKIQGKRVS